MKKKLFILLFLVVNIFAGQINSFLEPKEAFKSSFIEEKDSLNFSLKLAKDIYLYDERIKVFITKPEKIDLTKEIKLPKPEKYKEFVVHFDRLNIDIPYELIKSKLNSSKYEIQVKFQGCSKAGLCYAPMSDKIIIDMENKNVSEASNHIEVQKVENDNLNETDAIANTLKSGSFFLILVTFFGFGLLLSLTPCVFPMIPILSSIIVGASNNEKMTASKGFFLSFIYVLAMSLAYTIAGVIAGIFGANLQVALQNPWVLGIFAIIFIALAFSMFGYFKLELPQSIQSKINKTTEGKEKQGILGVAIMGFLSALIVGPCVAPPLAGALVYIGQTGDALLGGAALFVMSLGMGVPLLLIGLGAGKFMPKPGGWMENVSKIFGIIMLAVAIWLLSRVFNETIIMYLWGLLFLGTAIYLKIYNHILLKLLSLVSLIFGLAIFIGAISGATNPLKPLEKFTQIKSQNAFVMKNELSFKKIKNLKELEKEISNSNKPIMLDFYADWCVACKEFEEITFKNKDVISKMKAFTLLKVDVTKNSDEDKAIQKRFGIVGPPALVFWDINKQEVNSAKIVGYKNPEEFLSIINGKFKNLIKD